MKFPFIADSSAERSVSSCETAAMLITLGFHLTPKSMATLCGDGVQGGRRMEWSFTDICELNRFRLRDVLRDARNIDAHPGPQGYILAAFQNYRALKLSIAENVSLRYYRTLHGPYVLTPNGGDDFRRDATQKEIAISDAHRMDFASFGTVNTQLVAGLAAIGFEPQNTPTLNAKCVSDGHLLRTWYMPERSADGAYNVHESVARIEDSAWCSRIDNTDPRAVVSDAFWNLNACRRAAEAACGFIQCKNGRRTVLVHTHADDIEWERAERFLYSK